MPDVIGQKTDVSDAYLPGVLRAIQGPTKLLGEGLRSIFNLLPGITWHHPGLIQDESQD
jgi:hypothetical protein